jgi:hypothetical protein
MKQSASKSTTTASQLITRQIADLPDWRGELLAALRQLILEAAPGIVEEWKWDTAVWSQDGLVCSAAAFKDHVKLNFFQGASLNDPKGLFNSGLEAKATRAIDFRQGDKLKAPALKALIASAVAYNISARKKK